MKKLILILVVCGATVGCKEDKGGDSADEAPTAPKALQINTQGCTAAKHGHDITITCADGSAATFSDAPSSYMHPKDSRGAHAGLRLISGNTFQNASTGHLVTYDTDGIMGLDTVFYEASNCSGQGWAQSPLPSLPYTNLLLSNRGGAPQGVTAFSLGATQANVTTLSKYQNGACVNQTITNNWGAWSKVTNASMDSDVPEALDLPFEVISD